MAPKLELQLDLARKTHAKWFLVSCSLTARTPRADYVWPRRYPDRDEPLCEYLLVRNSLFRGEGSVQTSTFFGSRKLFEQCAFQPDLKKHQDTDWLLRAAKLPGFQVLFVQEPLVLHFIEEERQTVSSAGNWNYSLNWARENRHLFTPRAYSAFITNQVAPEAAEISAWSSIFPLLREAWLHGNTRPREFVHFVGMWMLPRKLRRKIRDHLSRLQVTNLRNAIAKSEL
jgi:hypothetical protein